MACTLPNPEVENCHFQLQKRGRLRETIGRHRNYLGRLLKRMERREFPHTDPLYRVTTEAFDVMHHLHIMVHYRACDAGAVGGRLKLELPEVETPRWVRAQEPDGE